jgi:mycofactocin precursor
MSENAATAVLAASAEVTDHADRTDTAPGQPLAAAPAAQVPAVEVTDLLVEEVSIDGMCGVY